VVSSPVVRFGSAARLPGAVQRRETLVVELGEDGVPIRLDFLLTLGVLLRVGQLEPHRHGGACRRVLPLLRAGDGEERIDLEILRLLTARALEEVAGLVPDLLLDVDLALVKQIPA
jgi:hypothetical protein